LLVGGEAGYAEALQRLSGRWQRPFDVEDLNLRVERDVAFENSYRSETNSEPLGLLA
jgi:hypothetical protein